MQYAGPPEKLPAVQYALRLAQGNGSRFVQVLSKGNSRAGAQGLIVDAVTAVTGDAGPTVGCMTDDVTSSAAVDDSCAVSHMAN